MISLKCIWLDEEHNENVEDEIPVEYDYTSESKHHVANISNVQL